MECFEKKLTFTEKGFKYGKSSPAKMSSVAKFVISSVLLCFIATLVFNDFILVRLEKFVAY